MFVCLFVSLGHHSLTNLNPDALKLRNCVLYIVDCAPMGF